MFFPALSFAPGPDPGPQFLFTSPDPDPQFLFTGPGPLCVYRPWPPICIPGSGPLIFIYLPWSVRSLGLHIPTLSPQFVFTGPGLRFLLSCSEFEFIFLSIVVAVAVVILAIVVIS